MLQIVNYSEKSIAVIGDTREIKDQLKQMGGSFNSRLSCGAGWIFSAKKRADVENLINGGAASAKAPVNEALKDMAVYVGTYHKYNCGSIAGKWLRLADYASKDEFLKACRAVHGDEADPELMFQGYEGIPSWMIGESFIDAEIWNLKPEKETGKQTAEQKRAYFEKCGCKGDLDYYAKQSALIVEVNGKCFDIPKPTIETKFCHPDEPEDEARAFYQYARTYDYFHRENMDGFEKTIKSLTEDEKHIVKSDYTGMWEMCWERQPGAELMDDKTRQALIKGYKQVAKDFEKCLQAWWKRYGAEKLYVWTYWDNR